MRNKIISLKENVQQTGWHFPFTQEEAQQFRFSIKPGEVTWLVPKELLKDYPEQADFLYTNIFGHYLVICATEEDLVKLDHLFVDASPDKYRARYIVFPNTDDSPTKKTAKGYRMKVNSRNLALRERMEPYAYTVTSPATPHIALGRYLVIPGQPAQSQEQTP